MNKNFYRNIAWIFLAMFFVGDRFLKFLFVHNYLSTPIKIFGDWLALNFTPNYYIAFSLPFGGLGLNLLISFIVLVLFLYIIYLIFAKKTHKSEFIPLTILILGAISNLLDRWRYGYVIDYFDLKYFTVFNLADVMIVGAVVIIIWLNFKKYE